MSSEVGFIGRWITGPLFNAAATPFAAIGAGVIDGVQGKFQPGGAFKNDINRLLFESPQQIVSLVEVLRNILRTPSYLSSQVATEVHAALNLLLTGTTLSEIDATFPQTDREALEALRDLFEVAAGGDAGDYLEALQNRDAGTQAQLERGLRIVQSLAERQRGVLVAARQFLEDALISNPKAALVSAAEILRNKAQSSGDQLFTSVRVLLQECLPNASDPLHVLSAQLNTDEAQLLRDVVALMGRKHGAANFSLSAEEHAQILLSIQTTFNQQLTLIEAADQIFRSMATRAGGLLANLSAEDQRVINEALALTTLTAAPDRALLARALRILIDQYNVMNEQVFREGIEALARDAQIPRSFAPAMAEGDRALIARGQRWLQAQLQSPGDAVSKVGARLSAEGDGVQAVRVLQAKSFEERCGLIRVAITQINTHIRPTDAAVADQLIAALQRAPESHEMAFSDEMNRALAEVWHQLRIRHVPYEHLMQINQRLVDDHRRMLNLLTHLTNKTVWKLVKAYKMLDGNALWEGSPIRHAAAQIGSGHIQASAQIAGRAADLLALKIREMDGHMPPDHPKVIDREGLLGQAMSALGTVLNEQESTALRKAQSVLADTSGSNGPGMIPQALDLVQARLEQIEARVFDRVEQMPKRMLDYLMGRTPAPPAQEGTTVADAPAPALSWLAWASQMLQNITGDGAASFAPAALAQFTTLLSQGISQAITALEGQANMQPQVGQLRALQAELQTLELYRATILRIRAIESAHGAIPLDQLMPIVEDLRALQAAQGPGLDLRLPPAGQNLTEAAARVTIAQAIEALQGEQSWGSIRGRFNELRETLGSIKIFVNNFRVPQIGSGQRVSESVEPAFQEQVLQLRRAMQAEAAPAAPLEWKAAARAQIDLLVQNTARFVAMRHVWVNTYKLPPDNQLFYRLLQQAKRAEVNTGVDADRELERLLFAELDRKPNNWFKRKWASYTYRIVNFLGRRGVQNGAETFYAEVFSYIEKHKATQFDAFRAMLVGNFTTYFTVLGDAFEKVAQNPLIRTRDSRGVVEPDGSIGELLAREMEKPECNLGHTPDELYAQFLKMVIQRCAGNSFLGWLFNLFVRHPDEIMRSIVDQSLGSLTDVNGYSHAFNTVLCELLTDVWEMMQRANAGGAQGPQDPAEHLSPQRRAELISLIKVYFEVLLKSKAQTKQELRSILEGANLAEKVNTAIDGLFMDDVIDKATLVIAAATATLLREDQLQKFVYQFTMLANRVYDVGEPYSPETVRATEKRLQALSERILHFAVDSAVADKLHSSSRVEQQKTNEQITDLEQRTAAALQDVTSRLRDLQAMNLSSDEAQLRIDAVVQTLHEYAFALIEKSSAVKGSQLSTDNKNELLQRLQALETALGAVMTQATAMQTHLNAITLQRSASIPLRAIETTLANIQARITAPWFSAQELDIAIAQVATLEAHLAEIRSKRPLQAAHDTLKAQILQIAATLTFIKQQKEAMDLCQRMLAQNSPLEQLALQNPGNAPALAATLESEILRSLPAAHRPFFLEQLAKLKRPGLPAERRDILAQITRAAGVVYQNCHGELGQGIRQYTAAWAAIRACIGATQHLNPETTTRAVAHLRTCIEQAGQNIATFAGDQARILKPVAYLNLTPLDLSSAQDVASGLIYSRIAERFAQSMQFWSSGDTYRGLLHHILLIPYVRAHS